MANKRRFQSVLTGQTGIIAYDDFPAVGEFLKEVLRIRVRKERNKKGKIC